MFLGHLGVGLAAKKYAPKTSLGTLLLSATLLDILWPVFLLLGLEQVRIEPGNTAITPLNFTSYPYSHSLLATAIWSTAFALAYWRLSGYRNGAWAVFLAVASHWALDFISHGPDMPVFPWGELKVGLGLWNSVPATLLAEGAIFGLGIFIYLQTTQPKSGKAQFALWSFWAVSVLAYFGSVFGPPPPGEKELAVFALFGSWLSPAWGVWVEKTREVR